MRSNFQSLFTAAFQQESQRVQSVPSCLEAQQLPDLQTLNDRMSSITYSSGCTAPVDAQAARLASVALDVSFVLALPVTIRSYSS